MRTTRTVFPKEENHWGSKEELERFETELKDNEFELHLITQHFETTDDDDDGNLIEILGPLEHKERFTIEEIKCFAYSDHKIDIWCALIWYCYGFELYFIVRDIGKKHFFIKVRKPYIESSPSFFREGWWEESEHKFKKVNKYGKDELHSAIVNLYYCYISRRGLAPFESYKKIQKWDEWFRYYYTTIEQIASLGIEKKKHWVKDRDKKVYLLLTQEGFDENEREQIRNYRNSIAHGERINFDQSFTDMTNRLKIAAEVIVDKAVRDVLNKSF